MAETKDSEDLRQLETYLETLRPQVSKQLTAVSAADRENPYLLHISKKKDIRVFVPQVSRRAAMSEDNTVPRVNVAPTLLGCIIAYAAVAYDFGSKDVKGKIDSDYKGGYYIYGFEDIPSVKPSSRLVYDQVATDEQWLLPYKEPGQVYKGQVIGKFFLSQVSSKPIQEEDRFNIDGVIYLELNEQIAWSRSRILPKGYYRITGELENPHLTYRSKNHKVEQISKSDFEECRTREVTLLSREVLVKK